mmetsp:Transcript_2624/g.4000  ORF Transcript_2624/g.4000 Transcript_2624/m.4000 type:complete len:80 (+) Transcript_2624:960-1199(+)
MLSLAAAVAAVWAMPWPIRPSPMQPSLSKLDTGVVDEMCRRAKRIRLKEEEVAASRRTAEAEIIRVMISVLCYCVLLVL